MLPKDICNKTKHKSTVSILEVVPTRKKRRKDNKQEKEDQYSYKRRKVAVNGKKHEATPIGGMINGPKVVMMDGKKGKVKPRL